MMFANVGASPPATEPEASTGTGRHPLTPGPTRDPTHPESRACRYVPCSSLCPPSATTCLGERGRDPPNSTKRGDKTPRPGTPRDGTQDNGRGGRRAGATSARPSQPSREDRRGGEWGGTASSPPAFGVRCPRRALVVLSVTAERPVVVAVAHVSADSAPVPNDVAAEVRRSAVLDGV